MASCLFHYAMASIDEDQGGICRRGAGHHVPCVLNVPGGIGDNKLARRGGKVAVGDVNGNALFALIFKTVGQ